MNNEYIMQLEEELRQAILNSDTTTLSKLIDDTLIYTTHSGIVIDKEKDLFAHESGIIKFSKLEPSEQTVQIYKNFAVVTVKMFLEGVFDNVNFSESCRFTRVWLERKDGWRIVAGHASLVL